MENLLIPRTAILVLQAMLLLLCWKPVAASELESALGLQNKVRDFLIDELNEAGIDQYDIVVNELDPRLRLKQCEQPVKLSFLGQKKLSGKVNVRLGCAKPSWGIFIPAQIQVKEPVVVSTVSLPRGSRISASQVKLQNMETSSLHYTYFRKMEEVIGTTTTRAIKSGDTIFTNMVKASNAVHKGDSVVIRAVVGSLAVRIKGTALQDGAIGKQIRVRNDQSQRIIRAVVTGSGQVEVPM